MSFQATSITHVGNRKSVNEDNFLVDRDHGVFAVADGVSGRARGEVASQMVVDGLKQRAQGLFDTMTERDVVANRGQRRRVVNLLGQTVDDLNAEVFLQGRAADVQGAMATTLASLFLLEQAGFVVHVGDSRVYVMRQDKIFRITEDHTYAELLRKQGNVEASSKILERYEHVLSKSIGTQPHVEAEVVFFDHYPGDVFFLCTDGLTDYLSGLEIQAYLKAYDDHTEALEAMVQEALGRGGHDNITAMIVKGQGKGEPVKRPSLGTLKAVDFLADVALFEGLDAHERLRTLKVVHEQTYEPGDVLISAASPSDAVHVIVQGQVEVRRKGHVLAVLGRGEHVGEMGLFGQEDATADVVVTEPTLMLSIPHHYVRMSLNAGQSNTLLWNISMQLARRLSKMNQRADER